MASPGYRPRSMSEVASTTSFLPLYGSIEGQSRGARRSLESVSSRISQLADLSRQSLKSQKQGSCVRTSIRYRHYERLRRIDMQLLQHRNHLMQKETRLESNHSTSSNQSTLSDPELYRRGVSLSQSCHLYPDGSKKNCESLVRQLVERAVVKINEDDLVQTEMQHIIDQVVCAAEKQESVANSDRDEEEALVSSILNNLIVSVLKLAQTPQPLPQSVQSSSSQIETIIRPTKSRAGPLHKIKKWLRRLLQ